MPFNLLKKYPELLEFGGMNETQRDHSLKAIFNRDIENNENFSFRDRRIWPMKGDKIPMELLFEHLTTSKEIIEITGEQTYSKRVFEPDRSKRLHWIRHHVEESEPTGVFYFSVMERNKGEDIVRTYIFDSIERYVVVLEPQRKQNNYYLLTAYYLNRPEGEKTIRKKMKRMLPDVV